MKILLTLFMNFILNRPTIKAVKNDLAIFNEGIISAIIIFITK